MIFFKTPEAAADFAVSIHGSVKKAISEVERFIENTHHGRNLKWDELLAHQEKLAELKRRVKK